MSVRSRARSVVTLIAFLPVLLVAFQNCGQKGFESMSASSLGSLAAVNLVLTPASFPVSKVQDQTFSWEAVTSRPDRIAKFKCQIDQGLPSECLSPFQTGELDEGAHMLTVMAVDKYDKTIVREEYTFVVDITPPTPSIVAGMTLTGSPNYDVVFAATDKYSQALTFECFVDEVSLGTCESPFKLTALAEGNHAFKVRATDFAGNTSTFISQAWLISLNAPEIKLTSTPPTFTGTTFSIDFTATSKVGIKVTTTCTLNAGTAAPCNGTFSANDLKAGAQTLIIDAVDELKRAAQTKIMWNVDLTPPTVKIMTPEPKVTNLLTFPISFMADDGTGVGLDSCECRTDANPFATCTSPSSISYTTDGPHTFEVACKDKLNNRSANMPLKVLFDRTAPTVTFASALPAVNAQNPTLTFTTADAISTKVDLQYSLNGGAFTASANPIQLANLKDGTQTLIVRAIDEAGNTSMPITVTWNTDVTPPTDPVGINLSAGGAYPAAMYLGWTPSSDAVSGVKEYDVKIGTTKGGDNIMPLTVMQATSKQLSFDSPLFGEANAYKVVYISVRARDNAGNVSSFVVSNPVMPRGSAVSYGCNDIFVTYCGFEFGKQLDTSRATLEAKTVKYTNAAWFYGDNPDSRFLIGTRENIFPKFQSLNSGTFTTRCSLDGTPFACNLMAGPIKFPAIKKNKVALLNVEVLYDGEVINTNTKMPIINIDKEAAYENQTEIAGKVLVQPAQAGKSLTLRDQFGADQSKNQLFIDRKSVVTMSGFFCALFQTSDCRLVLGDESTFTGFIAAHNQEFVRVYAGANSVLVSTYAFAEHFEFNVVPGATIILHSVGADYNKASVQLAPVNNINASTCPFSVEGNCSGAKVLQ